MTISRGVDLSVLLIFRCFCPEIGVDAPIGVIQCAENKYGNRLEPNYGLISSIFFTLLHLSSEVPSSRMPSENPGETWGLARSPKSLHVTWEKNFWECSM
ncbi:hypothetical protein Y032_0067g54 [Ancylostoma ceylanicum]|uniref:Uncharacterized protein n=1 Tax=Ancylostoma ceylanicum TaxID=53326 RepID=A0A016U050_9BILA|nr:hypothetical protein Y032_0067g54 [Ancylostoma ceylanicum]